MHDLSSLILVLLQGLEELLVGVFDLHQKASEGPIALDHLLEGLTDSLDLLLLA